MSLNDFLLLLFSKVCTSYVAVVILRSGGFKGGRGERAPSLFFTITCFLQSLCRSRNCVMQSQTDH